MSIFKKLFKILGTVFKGPKSLGKSKIKASTSQTRFVSRASFSKKKAGSPKKVSGKGKVKKKVSKPAPKQAKALKSPDKPVPEKKPAKPAKPKKAPPEFFVGEITHFFSKISVVVVQVAEHPILVGDLIHIKGSGDFTQKVDSLQVESKDVRFARKGELVGLKVIHPAKPGDKVFKIKK